MILTDVIENIVSDTVSVIPITKWFSVFVSLAILFIEIDSM